MRVYPSHQTPISHPPHLVPPDQLPLYQPLDITVCVSTQSPPCGTEYSPPPPNMTVASYSPSISHFDIPAPSSFGRKCPKLQCPSRGVHSSSFDITLLPTYRTTKKLKTPHDHHHLSSHIGRRDVTCGLLYVGYYFPSPNTLSCCLINQPGDTKHTGVWAGQGEEFFQSHSYCL